MLNWWYIKYVFRNEWIYNSTPGLGLHDVKCDNFDLLIEGKPILCNNKLLCREFILVLQRRMTEQLKYV